MPLVVVGYLAVFSVIGIALTRPLTASLTYFLVIELILGNLPAKIRTYTISHQIRLEVLDAMPDVFDLIAPRMIREDLFPPDARGFAVLAGVVIGSLIFSTLWVSKRELLSSHLARE